MSKTIFIGGRLESKEKGNVVAGANAILDDTKGKKQNVINKETDDELLRLEQSKQDNLTFDNAPTEDSTNPVTSGGVYTAEKALSDAIEAILLLIPSAATALNKLVDTNTMNSSISTATATFRGTYNAVSDLGLTYQATHAQIEAALDALGLTADNNDYAFVQVPVSDQSQDIAKTERYKNNGTNWQYEYDLNTSGFTSQQWAAINSGITVALVTKLTDLPTAAALQLALNAKQDTLTFDTEPTALSQNPVTSGGIYTAIQAIATALSDYSTTTDGRLGVLEGLIPLEAASNNKLTDKAYVDGLIQAITELIPAEATTSNQLADKAYVLASILAATPAFKGQFTTLAELQAVASPKAGDLGIVRTKDSDGMDVFTVYQYLNNAWNVFFSLSYHPQTKPATTGTTGDYPYNGMGRVELAKNMVNTGTELAPVMVNQLTQDMFYKGAVGSRVPNTNTIFVIRYDYVLAENITIPDGCVLEFEGGSIANASGNSYSVTGNSTLINSVESVFDCDVKGTIKNNVIEAKWIKNPTSERLQFLIDSMYSGQTFLFDNIEYNLTKNLNIPSTNPVTEENDQPCIQFKDKSNITIDGNNAVLKVGVHAQGIVEICHCTDVVIKNMTLQGYGQFVPLDTTAGHEGVGEKGSLGDKYYTVAEYWNYCKNNCRDTSNNYQYRTEENPTGNGQHWGTFGGGYIGNIGIGLLVYRGSENIIVDNIEAHGFNFTGIQVGFMMDNEIHDINHIDLHSVSKNVTVINCHCHHNDDAGIGTVDCDKFIIQNNTCHDFGFFDGFPATYTNDGYGIYHSHAFNGIVTNGIVDSNIVYNCARKGIDFHAGDNSIISNNRIYDCYSSAIYAVASSAIQRAFNLDICNNSIYNCGQASSAEGVIIVGGRDELATSAPELNIKITGNFILNSGKYNDDIAPITLYRGKNVVISDNIISIDEVWASTAERQAAGEVKPMCAIVVGHGTSGGITTSDVCVKNNVLRGEFKSAIRCFSATDVVIEGNVAFCNTSTQDCYFADDNHYNNDYITVINNIFHNSKVTPASIDNYYGYALAAITNLVTYGNELDKGKSSPERAIQPALQKAQSLYFSPGQTNTIPIKKGCSMIILTVDATGEDTIILTSALSTITLLGNPSYISTNNESDKCYVSKDVLGETLTFTDNRTSGSGYVISYTYVASF